MSLYSYGSSPTFTLLPHLPYNHNNTKTQGKKKDVPNMLSSNQKTIQSNTKSVSDNSSKKYNPGPYGQLPPGITPVRTALIQGTRTRVNSSWPKHPLGLECIEEYDTKTDVLLLRKWRHRTPLGAMSSWEIEVGDVPRTVISTNPSAIGADLLIAESTSAPTVTRKDSSSHFLWRIRNVPWPKSVYDVSVDLTARRLVVRTSNKKYFTRLPIPDLDRLGAPFDSDRVSFDWGSNTLVVMYEKPQLILAKEQRDKQERLNLLGMNSGSTMPTASTSSQKVAKSKQESGDPQCNQQ